MPKVAHQLAIKWHRDGLQARDGSSYLSLYERLEFLDKKHYSQYLPTQGAGAPEFLARLSRWLENVPDDEDRRLLLEFAPRLVFFGTREFTKLYQRALSGPIARWVIDELGLGFDAPGLQDKLWAELEEHTWYCPITDSMRIGDFHNANNLGGVDHRPSFRWLSQMADIQAIDNALPASVGAGQRPAACQRIRAQIQRQVRQLMETHGDALNRRKPLRRVVLLEDFVGAGTQIDKAIEFAATLRPSVPVLFLPLIICPLGAKNARTLAATFPNVQCSPTVELEEDLFINRKSHLAPGSFESHIRDLAIRTYARVKGNDTAWPRPYGEFGFDGTGATVAMYSNTPANTLPMVQHKSTRWQALFPRSARIR